MTMDFKDSPRGSAPSPVTSVVLRRCRPDGASEDHDTLATEEPLEIRLGYQFLGKPAERSVAVTMRTPGDDLHLAMGFLFSEGLIERADQIIEVEAPATNILRLRVGPDVDVDMASLQRNFYTTSSCGVCGKASLEALKVDEAPLVVDNFQVPAAIIASLTDTLRQSQSLFDVTGGIHAAGLFERDGQLVTLAEDVGRHNAMDKLVGSQLSQQALPLSEAIVVWSGRASFELVQKALRAGASIVVAVGAPSSLAVDVAQHFGITLVGFARNRRFNIYSHPARIH